MYNKVSNHPINTAIKCNVSIKPILMINQLQYVERYFSEAITRIKNWLFKPSLPTATHNFCILIAAINSLGENSKRKKRSANDKITV